MVVMHHWSGLGSGLGIGNVIRPESEQPLNAVDHAPCAPDDAPNSATNYGADRTCGLAADRCAMLDAVGDALRIRHKWNCQRSSKHACEYEVTLHHTPFEIVRDA